MVEFTDVLQNYTGVMVLTCLFLTASIVVIVTNRTVDHRARKAFVITCVALICVVLTDWFSVAIDGASPDLRAVHALTTAITFSLAPAIPVALVTAIFPSARTRWIWVIVGAHVALEIASLFGGFVFWVDETGLYHRGPLYPVYILAYALTCVYLVVQSIRAGRAYQSSNIATIVAIIICIAVGIFMQLAFSPVHTSWTAVAMGTMLYFAYYCDLTLRNDALTRLLNRGSYEELLEAPPVPSVVVSLDLDDFKLANDENGHSYGDVCLTTIAGLIRRVYGNVGKCFRTGGDEFAVVMTKRLSDAEKLASDFATAVEEARAKDGRIPRVSVGYAAAGADCADFQAVIDAADKMMYEMKRARKARD